MPSTALHPSLGDFYLSDVRRLSSPEHDLGLWWRADLHNCPVFRAAYVEATGEVYVMQHEGLPGGGRVQVVATRGSLVEALADLEGFEDVCGEPGSLRWLLERLARAPQALAA